MSVENIKVSVITPTYNGEKFIRETLESILGQTHKNLEVLIVDDCSTDNTIQIIESFNDERIRLFKNQTNSGAAFSRNKALSEATGDYIAFLDSDDLWAPTKLEEQLHYMTQNRFSFCCTNYSIIDGDGKRTGKYISGPKVITHKRFLRMNYAGCLTVVFKRDLYPNLHIPNEIKKRNDYALWLKISERAPCYRLNKNLAMYRKRKNGSLSSGSKIQLLHHHKELFKRLYGFNSIKSFCLSLRNVFYYLIKRVIYTKKEKLIKQ